MPVYTLRDDVKHGMPLGGIGAGKFEILPNGLWNAFTFLNNWSQPLSGNGGYPGLLGYHLGIWADGKAMLLQTEPLLKIPTVKNIRYEALFPKLRMTYKEPSLGVAVSLEAFSSFIPGDVKNSSLPACFFSLTLKNLKKKPVDLGFLFIARNICGDGCVGRQNRIFKNDKSVDLELSNRDPAGKDSRQGALRFRFDTQGWKTSTLESWNAVTKNFHFNSENISLLAWDAFAKNRDLPSMNPRGSLNPGGSGPVRGENRELCGAVAFRKPLKAFAEAELPFAAAWHFPTHPEGHRYAQNFQNAERVVSYAVSQREKLRRKVGEFQKLTYAMPFPEWFCDALLTNLAPFFSSSWYGNGGRFAFYEAPVACPLMGTLDVGFYGSIPLSFFFPELEISQITQFAKAQRKDGYIPHDLGRSRLDLASDGTTFYRWKDLNPKFILMTYRDFLWSKDFSFLKKMLPHVKAALEWSIRQDKDGNGLPDHEGEDQTFDLWEFHGTQAYTGGLFLAALLACQKIAALLRDEKFLLRCRKLFAKGRFSFERELWNGRFFGKTCVLSQLNGQWVADLLDLGSIADDSKIKTALRSVMNLNSKPSRYGLVNSVLPDGRLDTSNKHAKNIWFGMNYAFLSLCLSRGFPIRILLKEVQKLWNNSSYKQKNPWNLPDMLDSKTGRYLFGDSYYRNMAIWAIPLAAAKKDKKTAKLLQKLRSIS